MFLKNLGFFPSEPEKKNTMVGHGSDPGQRVGHTGPLGYPCLARSGFPPSPASRLQCKPVSEDAGDLFNCLSPT